MAARSPMGTLVYGKSRHSLFHKPPGDPTMVEGRAIDKFNVVWTDEYPVHATVQALFEVDQEPITTTKNIMQASLTDAFERYVKEKAEESDLDNKDVAHKKAKKETLERAHRYMDQLLADNNHTL